MNKEKIDPIKNLQNSLKKMNDVANEWGEEKNICEILKGIKKFRKKVKFKNVTEKYMEKQLDIVCDFSNQESHNQVQSNKKDLGFFWQRLGGTYYNIWRTGTLLGIAQLVIKAPFRIIVREFLKQNNGWH